MALVMFPDENHDRWERIVSRLPDKSVDQVFQHYRYLVQDLTEIRRCDWLLGDRDGGGEDDVQVMTSFRSGSGRETTLKRRKGTPWTEAFPGGIGEGAVLSINGRVGGDLAEDLREPERVRRSRSAEADLFHSRIPDNSEMFKHWLCH